MMMLVRLISTCFFLVTVVAVVINASELRLRGAKPRNDGSNTDFAKGFIKAEIDVEKGLKCKEKVDSIKIGVGNKECEGGMEKNNEYRYSYK